MTPFSFDSIRLSRRGFLQSSLVAGAALTLRPGTTLAQAADSDPYGGFHMGLQSYSLRAFDVDRALAASTKLGIKYWESFSGHFAVTTVPAQIQEYKAKLEQAGITMNAFGVVGFDSNESKAREIFDFAKAMGLQSISANPNKDDATFDLLDKLVEEYQIPIAIHNHGPGALYDKVQDVLDVVKDRHPLIGACVDTGHYLRSDEDPVEVVHKLGHRVYGVHLKDVRTIRSDDEKSKLLKELDAGRANQLKNEGKIFTILGEGELNIVGLFRALREIDYDRSLSLEYEENPQNPLSDIELCLRAAREAVAYLDDPEEDFVSIWDGKTFDGWKINERPETWSIKDGEIIAHGDRSHLFYVGDLAPFRDFELKVDVMAEPHSNGGIYFHTKFQEEGWPAAGFETQVNNSYNTDPRKTGSLYGVDDVHRQMIPDNTWWTQHIIVKGNHVTIKVDGKTAVDYTQKEGQKAQSRDFARLVGEGTFAFQGHDPGSTTHYKNVRVKKL